MRRLGWILLGTLIGFSAQASERRFAYAQDTGVLPPGAKELELNTTARVDHGDASWLSQNRVELEMGLTERLQTSLYFNFDSVVIGPVKQADLGWSLSNEWKLKLADAVADPVGFGLYGELTAGFHGLELEGKALFDKQVGPWLVALNLIGAHEWEFTQGAPNRDIEFEGDLGAAYFLNPALSFGLELVSHGVQASDAGFEGNAFYFGPVVTYAVERMWITGSLAPRVAQIRPQGSTGDVEDGFVGRVLIGFHL